MKAPEGGAMGWNRAGVTLLGNIPRGGCKVTTSKRDMKKMTQPWDK